MVSTSQYSVAAKLHRAPVSRPATNACRAETADEHTIPTTSGVSAIQAHAGWPYFGKLSARSAPGQER